MKKIYDDGSDRQSRIGFKTYLEQVRADERGQFEDEDDTDGSDADPIEVISFGSLKYQETEDGAQRTLTIGGKTFAMDQKAWETVAEVGAGAKGSVISLRDMGGQQHEFDVYMDEDDFIVFDAEGFNDRSGRIDFTSLENVFA